MKHILVYIIAALMIFTGVGRFAAAEEAAKAPARVMAMAKTGAPDEAHEIVKVGLLLAEVDTIDEVYFRNALANNLGEEVVLHTLETSAVAAEQQAMFQKMMDEKYKLVVVQLFDRELVDGYIDLASQHGAMLIFTGVQPTGEQMNRMQDLYYVGYASSNALREVADAAIKAWNNNRPIIDLNKDDILSYGVLAGSDFEESGGRATFEGYLRQAGIQAAMGYNSITQAFSFDLEHEIDRIWVAKPKADFILCDNSGYARQASNYLNNPEEFEDNKIRLFLTTADEGAKKMVEEGVALFATGSDGHDLGATTAQLAQLLLRGEKPTSDNMGIPLDKNKYMMVPNRSIEAKELGIVVPLEKEKP